MDVPLFDCYEYTLGGRQGVADSGLKLSYVAIWPDHPEGSPEPEPPAEGQQREGRDGITVTINTSEGTAEAVFGGTAGWDLADALMDLLNNQHCNRGSGSVGFAEDVTTSLIAAIAGEDDGLRLAALDRAKLLVAIERSTTLLAMKSEARNRATLMTYLEVADADLDDVLEQETAPLGQLADMAGFQTWDELVAHAIDRDGRQPSAADLLWRVRSGPESPRTSADA